MSEPHDQTDVSIHGLPVARDAEGFRAREPLEILVSRFTDAVRRGKRPSVEEYALRYSEWADEIREIFPLIESLERWKGEKEVECLRRSVPEEFPVQRLGEYRLGRELGRGGMGIVLEAEHESSGQHFALKLLPWRFAADMEHWKERFQREAATIARLRHPNIVRVFGFGTHEGYCYYAMQLVEGVSLDWIIRRLRETNDVVYVDEIRRARHPDGTAPGSRLDIPTEITICGLHRDSWVEFADIGHQVALALGHAHESGVLHNDIKPANLLLERTGRVIVTDFGIGRRAEESEPEAAEQPTGTLRYMAPERLAGHSETRSDIYALGLTLYELVTRVPAFDIVDRRQLAEAIMRGAVRRPRELVPHIPRGLETIILNAMAPLPEDRYASAAAMAVDLLRFINGRSIHSTRPGLLGRAVRWATRSTNPGPSPQ